MVEMGGASRCTLVVHTLLPTRNRAYLYRDRNGWCIAILFKSIGVGGRCDSPDFRSSSRAAGSTPLALPLSDRLQTPPHSVPNHSPSGLDPVWTLMLRSCRPFTGVSKPSTPISPKNVFKKSFQAFRPRVSKHSHYHPRRNDYK